MNQLSKRFQLIDSLTTLSTMDKKNLKYIISLSGQKLDQWYSEATDEELDYVEELYLRAATEVSLKNHLASVQEKFIEDVYDKVEDTTEAKEYLKNFTLKGDYNGNTNTEQP